jgi:hypothetical protein
MSLHPLFPVSDYQSMINRICWFTSASALAGVWLLRQHNPALDELLRQIDFRLAFGGDKIVPVPGGYLLPALTVGILTRIFRLHARISDWLGIRECFDLDVIIAELVRRLAIDLSNVPREQLVERRHAIMRQAFYPFVSSRQTPIDRELVLQALDAWSWFWIGIEATLVFTLTGLVLVAGGAYEAGFLTIAGTLLAANLALPAMRSQCQRYAVAQVRAILADPARANAVRCAFDELDASGASFRDAA